MYRKAHDRNDADLLQGKEDNDKFTDVRKLQQNDIARLQTEIEQAQRHTSGEPVHVAIAKPSRCIRDERAVGEVARARFQYVADTVGFPVPSSKIVLNKSLRPGRAILEHESPRS